MWSSGSSLVIMKHNHREEKPTSQVYQSVRLERVWVLDDTVEQRNQPQQLLAVRLLTKC